MRLWSARAHFRTRILHPSIIRYSHDRYSRAHLLLSPLSPSDSASLPLLRTRVHTRILRPSPLHPAPDTAVIAAKSALSNLQRVVAMEEGVVAFREGSCLYVEASVMTSEFEWDEGGVPLF